MLDARVRRWVAGRVVSLRLDGSTDVDAWVQATLEAKQKFAAKPKRRRKAA